MQRGERRQIKSIDFGLARFYELCDPRTEEDGETCHKLQAHRVNDDFWDMVCWLVNCRESERVQLFVVETQLKGKGTVPLS